MTETAWLAPSCPGCGQAAEPYTYPPHLEVLAPQAPKPWWCMACLNEKVRKAREGR